MEKYIIPKISISKILLQGANFRAFEFPYITFEIKLKSEIRQNDR
jgi:hypothetical protein